MWESLPGLGNCVYQEKVHSITLPSVIGVVLDNDNSMKIFFVKSIIITYFDSQIRHNKIFNVLDGVTMIHVAGDNDIGGEWMDSITQNLVSRFSQHFGSINEIIEIKSFQIVKVRKPISKIEKISLAHRD